MNYNTIIIGGGLSGLTAGALLAKKGIKVCVIDKSYNPGGTCGIFKRGDTTFDQGSAMMFGFGERGFNGHRFVFNCLEEPIDIVRHDLLYTVNYNGHKVHFYPDVDKFAEQLAELFPSEKENIARFYHDMTVMYHDVMVEVPSYNSADETDPKTALKSMKKHPKSYIRFLSYLNKSAKSLLQQYFKNPDIFNFFDKLTSTYCYSTVEEAPAVLAAVMFVDNHVGGSYYPAGSTLFVPGKLEKVIEENHGDMLLQREVVSILFDKKKPIGVLLDNGEKLYAENIVYSGTVWNLYGKLLPEHVTSKKKREWAKKLVPTYPSVVLYATVKKEVIPEGTSPIEMLVGNPNALDESEVTAYILSIDDQTLCPGDRHTVVAIGPTFEQWNELSKEDYQAKKQKEIDRLVGVLEKRFTGFADAILSTELATPKTIEHYTMKNGGAVAGPKQMLGQHMFRRQHIRTKWNNLFCCGESTVMGTGTPTVTVSGVSCANAILKKMGLAPFEYEKDRKNYVRIVEKPFTADRLFEGEEQGKKDIMLKAMKCLLCKNPTCSQKSDIRGIMRRVAVGNIVGAQKCLSQAPLTNEELAKCEQTCRRGLTLGEPVAIAEIIKYLQEHN